MLFCRPVMLRGQNPCMFPPIPGHCYAPLPSAHKQNKSIMNEAFPLFSSAVPLCQSVGRPWSERPYKQPLFHYSYRCFNEEVDLTLLAQQPCKQPRYCHTTLTFAGPAHSPRPPFLTVVCRMAFFLYWAHQKNLAFHRPPLSFPLLHSMAVRVSQQPKLCLAGSAALVYEFFWGFFGRCMWLRLNS